MDFSSCRTVGDVARAVAKGNRSRYTPEVIDLITKEHGSIRLDDAGNVRASERLNEARFEKEAELCKRLGVAYPPTRMHEEITYKRCLESFGHGRTPEIGKLCTEIKFLFNVASVLDHW